MATQQTPLGGTRLLSVGHTMPGMYCMAILRDLGVDVTRIERMSGAKGADRYAAVGDTFPTRSLLAGTSVCELNLKAPQGRDCFVKMARQADIVLEGFRPGVAARLGAGYETLAKDNPALVYAAVSGYGQGGPFRDRVGHDINYLAESGLLDLTGPADGPPVFPGFTCADGLAGINAAMNILAALHARARTGKGQFLDVAIVDGALFLMSMEFEHYWETGSSRTRGDTHLTGRYPFYHLFETKDGGYMSVGAVEAPFYARLCHVLGRPDLAGRQFAEGEEREELLRFFADTFRTKTRAEWTALLAGEETCVAPVVTPGEAADAPQNQRARHPHASEDSPLVRSPVRLDVAPIPKERNTAETLESYGVPRDEVAALQRQGAAGP